MRLKFKPQSTFYTCDQATQAIAINSFLGTDYTDLDIVAKNRYGFPLKLSTLAFAQDIVSQDFDTPLPLNQTYFFLRQGLFRVLTNQQRLPSYEVAVQTYIDFSTLDQQYHERRLRENPHVPIIGPEGPEKKLTVEEVEEFIRISAQRADRERRSLEAIVRDPTAKLFFQKLSEHLDRELLKPINYRFYNGEDTNLGEVDIEFSAVTILSQGSLGVEPIGKEALLESVKRNDIVIFSAHRNSLDLVEYSAQLGHSWIVDRVEGDKVVLLDTNYHKYRQSPEIYVPLELLLNIELKGLVRVHKK